MAYDSPFGEDDPFTPAAAPPPPEKQAEIVQQWTQKLSDPNIRAMIMQTGLALMQPVGLGQTAAGHVGQAVGQGMEASDRVVKAGMEEREQQRKERDTDSRSELRAAQADKAAAGMGVAGANLDVKRQQLEISRERLQMQSTLGDLQRRIQAGNSYNAFVSKKNEQDANRSLIDPNYKPAPTPSFEEYMAGRGLGALNPVTTSEAAPPDYPDAKKAADGNWYVQRNGRYFKVKQ